MSTTYLEAVNEVLAETGEVELTSSNFSGAVNIQSLAKKLVNRAYMKVCSYKEEWPFLIAADSNTDDPFGGNVSIETTAGTRWYLLKTGSTSVQGDYKKVDWDSFFLTSEGATGQSTPYDYQNLVFLPYDTWADRLRTDEAADAGDEQNYGLPRRVMRSPDGRYFGLSPIPDDAYNIYFTAWVRPTRLSAHDDVLLIPDEYTNVVYDYARYLLYKFKEDTAQAQMAQRDFNAGLKEMVYSLIGEDVMRVTDDRLRF